MDSTCGVTVLHKRNVQRHNSRWENYHHTQVVGERWSLNGDKIFQIIPDKIGNGHTTHNKGEVFEHFTTEV